MWAGPGAGRWASWGLGCVLASGLGCEHGLGVWSMSESLGCRQSGGALYREFYQSALVGLRLGAAVSVSQGLGWGYMGWVAVTGVLRLCGWAVGCGRA